MPEKTTIPSEPSTATPAAINNTLLTQESSQQDMYKEALQRLPIQRKLSIGAVDDPLEHEADSIADQVMRMPETPFIQRQCANCDEEEKQQIQTKPFASGISPFIQRKSEGDSVASDAVTNQIIATKGGGSSLPETTKSFMESRFRKDFSGVNIHTGTEAAYMSRELNAQAFTIGNDIYFNEAKYQPQSSEGKHLLAHELTHVLQQRNIIRKKEKVLSEKKSKSVEKPIITDEEIEFIAVKIREATKGWGTDEEGVYRALQELGQNQTDISRLNSIYNKKFGESLESVIRDEMSGKELQFALELIGIKKGPGLIKSIPQTEKEYELAVDRLNKAMKGWGTDEEEIYAVLLPFRGNKEAFTKLKTTFQNKFNKNLEEELSGELSGSEENYAQFQMDAYHYFEYEARSILTYIQQQAQNRSKNPPSIDPSSHFYQRLKDYYLKDYFVNPSKASGKGAIDKIGRPMEGTNIGSTVNVKPLGGSERPAVDRWEEMAITWLNKQQIPPLPPKLLALPIFRNIKTLPKELGAATDILMLENWNILKNVDVPHLIGKDNLERANFDADVTGGGKNISQLMHWGTGVKYSEQNPDAMHELFLAYEMWHLEGWDTFGTDSLNDMIAEEQGRLLGTELLKGKSGAIKSETDLLPFLDYSFKQSRAWVGSILRFRREELNNWILSKKQKQAIQHWDENIKFDVWHSPTIYQMLSNGETPENVKKSELVSIQIEIYSLLYEADLWEKAHGAIIITELQKALVEGKLNHILAILALKESSKFSVSGNLGLVKDASNDLGKIGAGDVPISQLQ